MSTIHRCNVNRGYLVLFGLAILGAVLFWITVCCIATLVIFTSGTATTAQTAGHTRGRFVESGGSGVDETAPGCVMAFGGKNQRFRA